ncbi:MAG: hypothetical protein J5781_07365, partial [Clostridia bacterium]|nr:hypothetical protein [Clostridia bacterium]
LDAFFPKAESKIKITEPEALNAFLENVPDFGDYYEGAVKSGEYNEKPFRTFSVSERMVSNQTTVKSNGDQEVQNHAYTKTKMEIAYGSDSCLCTVEFYYIADNQDDKEEYDIKIDIYVAENIFYYRIRKFDFITSFLSAAGEVGSKVEGLLKKCIQSHLNEWIDGSFAIQEQGGSDMELALYKTVVLYSVSLWSSMTNNVNDELQQIINDYGTSKEKQTRTGGVILWEDVNENESRKMVTSNRIDLSGVFPYFEQRVDKNWHNGEDVVESSLKSTHYDIFGFDSTKVKKPRKAIDARSVYSELIDFLMEEQNNGGNK